MAVRIEDTEKVRALFGDWQETTRSGRVCKRLWERCTQTARSIRWQR